MKSSKLALLKVLKQRSQGGYIEHIRRLGLDDALSLPWHVVNTDLHELWSDGLVQAENNRFEWIQLTDAAYDILSKQEETIKEMLQAEEDNEHRRFSQKLHLTITWLTFIIAALFGGLGIAIIAIRPEGTANISIFGQRINSTNAGVTCIALSVILIIINIQRVLKSNTSGH